MPGRSFRIARVAGIPVGVHPLWLVIVALITWSLGAAYYPEEAPGISAAGAYALGFLSALLLFASILLHELGHALVARRYGVQVEEIDLWLLGGVARMSGEAHRPEDELRYAAAGPAVTLLVAAVFGAVALALPESTPDAIRALVEYQAFVNTAILVFNLIPAFPLDGGRVLRAVLWRQTGDSRRATEIAAAGGRLFGWFLIALGLLGTLGGAPGGLWLAVLGFFLLAASRAEQTHAEVEAAFSGVPAEQLMSTPALTVREDTTVDEALRAFSAHRFRAFPVVDAAGDALGVITLDRVAMLPRHERASVRVRQIADCDPALLVRPDQDVAALLETPAFARVGRAVVVDSRGAPAGLVSITDVERALAAARVARGRPGDARG